MPVLVHSYQPFVQAYYKEVVTEGWGRNLWSIFPADPANTIMKKKKIHSESSVKLL